MTLVQTVAVDDSAVDDSAEETAPQVWDDMTVEVALTVMAGARVGHLLVCDADSRRTGFVTRARLAAVRDGSGYTDRIRLRDIGSRSGVYDDAPVPAPVPNPVGARP